ncbi:MAG: hypothetical protein RIA69_19270 [Cyclobacteriaceae bacterium]
MKLPSFIKVQKYKRFEIEPRYYDPIKEEIEERTARIAREMKGENMTYVPSRISFERKVTSGSSAGFLQMAIAALLGLTVVGWLYYGNAVFYLLWLAAPVYLYIRLRSKFFKK